MDLVDYFCPEHAAAITEIRRFCLCPLACRPTGRVKQDLIRLRLTKGKVLDCAVRHIDARLPIHCALQTMYFEIPQLAYIIRPLVADAVSLYFKVALPQPEAGEKPYMLIMSAHEPDSKT
jgi:hypothetical protein